MVNGGAVSKKNPSAREGFESEELGLPAAAAAVATATAATIALLGLGHVHTHGAAVKLGAVEGSHRLVGGIVVLEGHETETARTARVAIGDHDGFADLAAARPPVYAPRL